MDRHRCHGQGRRRRDVDPEGRGKPTMKARVLLIVFVAFATGCVSSASVRELGQKEKEVIQAVQKRISDNKPKIDSAAETLGGNRADLRRRGHRDSGQDQGHPVLVLPRPCGSDDARPAFTRNGQSDQERRRSTALHRIQWSRP